MSCSHCASLKAQLCCGASAHCKTLYCNQKCANANWDIHEWVCVSGNSKDDNSEKKITVSNANGLELKINISDAKKSILWREDIQNKKPFLFVGPMDSATLTRIVVFLKVHDLDKVIKPNLSIDSYVRFMHALDYIQLDREFIEIRERDLYRYLRVKVLNVLKETDRSDWPSEMFPPSSVPELLNDKENVTGYELMPYETIEWESTPIELNLGRKLTLADLPPRYWGKCIQTLMTKNFPLAFFCLKLHPNVWNATKMSFAIEKFHYKKEIYCISDKMFFSCWLNYKRYSNMKPRQTKLSDMFKQMSEFLVLPLDLLNRMAFDPSESSFARYPQEKPMSFFNLLVMAVKEHGGINGILYKRQILRNNNTLPKVLRDQDERLRGWQGFFCNYEEYDANNAALYAWRQIDGAKDLELYQISVYSPYVLAVEVEMRRRAKMWVEAEQYSLARQFLSRLGLAMLMSECSGDEQGIPTDWPSQ